MEIEIEIESDHSSSSISDGDLSQFSEFAKHDFSYDITSEDVVESKIVMDYGTPKYIGN